MYFYHLLHEDTGGYKRVQRVTGGYTRLQKGYKGLQGVKRAYRGLQGVTGVTGAYNPCLYCLERLVFQGERHQILFLGVFFIKRNVNKISNF